VTLPEEVLAYAAPVEGNLGAGTPGKLGVLDVDLVAVNGVTRVSRQFQRAPLHLYQPIYLDPGLPGMAYLYLQQAGDGLVQGDRYRIDVSCADNTLVHVTTQTPTKVFACRQDYVSQLVELDVGSNACVEYLPDPVVPCAQSRLFQRTRVTLDRTASVLIGETLLPGRVAYGESHAYDLYWSELEVYDAADRQLLFADAQRMTPGGDADPRSLAVLGGFAVLATFHVVTRKVEPAELVAVLRSDPDRAGVLVGATELPNDCGATVRVLGDNAEQVRVQVRRAWDSVRRLLVGCGVPDLRKG
jgi:urease accessory protein